GDIRPGTGSGTGSGRGEALRREGGGEAAVAVGVDVDGVRDRVGEDALPAGGVPFDELVEGDVVGDLSGDDGPHRRVGAESADHDPGVAGGAAVGEGVEIQVEGGGGDGARGAGRLVDDLGRGRGGERPEPEDDGGGAAAA